MILPKQSYSDTKEIAPEELKAKSPNEIRTKEPNFSLKREYGVVTENFPPRDLEKPLQKFHGEMCNFSMPIINY